MTVVTSTVSVTMESKAAVVVATSLMTVTAKMEEEDDEEGKVKKFPFSKQVGVVLERENKFFLGRKEGNPKLLGGEFGWVFFGITISFGGERTKVGGLNLMMARNFSWEINSSFFI